MNSRNEGPAREVYLEFLIVGDSIKVTAIDSETGTEVSIVGPARAPRSDLEGVAVDKLHYVLGRQSSDATDTDEERSVKEGGKGWVA